MKKLLCLIVVLLPLCCKAQDKAAAIDSLLKGYAQRNDLNGCVLLAEKGKIIYQQAFGTASFELNVPNTNETKFEIASISKTFTALMVLQQVEKGKLKLDGKVTDYLPDYPAKSGNKITLRHLLLHTSGLTDTRFLRRFDVREGMQSRSREEFIDLFKNEELLFEPGTKWSYSNFGYNLLAYILEEQTGKSYHRLLKECIYDRCGMSSSTSLESREFIPGMASGYERVFGDVRPGHYHDASAAFGSGSAVCTTGDYFLFHQALMSYKLLSKSYTDSLLSPYTRMSGELTGYQFFFDKWTTGNKDSVTILRTAGNHFGWHSVAYHQRSNDKLLVMFLNVNSPKLFEIADNLTSILYDIPFEKPVEKNYARLLFNDIESRGITQAIAAHERRLAQTNYRKRFSDLNGLGYYYLNKNKADIAIEVFKLNVAMFPAIGDPYDSLGEAYLLSDQKELAIKNYKRALELDPGNDNARKMLHQLGEQK